jgi:hypothetical protein
MHKNYLEFIYAYYYLIVVAYFVILYVTKIYRLIELVAYHYQEVASAVLEAIMEGMEKLSMLRVEQCEDG